MAKVVIRIDRDVRDMPHPQVHAIAEAIAAGQDELLNPIVDDYETKGMRGAGDRKASSVTLRHPDALFIQARSGVLTRGAAAQGLEVTSRT